MFELLFTHPGVIRRHREGPLAIERAAYLCQQAALGLAKATILRLSSYSLCVAVELLHWPADQCFDEAEVDGLAATWAAERACGGRASSPRWPHEHFRSVAMDFLRSFGRLRATQVARPRRYESELSEFLAAQREAFWRSEQTCLSAKWQVNTFLDHIEQRGVALVDVVVADVDAFYEHMSQRWSRSSLRTSAKVLRAWFGYCETRGWVRAGLAVAILMPRVYRHEGLPMGPPWDEVGRMLTETSGGDSASIRDHAILLLLSVYGLRSGEVRQLRLDDIDWARDRLRVVRSKSGRPDTLPLETRVGNAIARYLHDARPKTESRVIFLTLSAPYRPLSAGGLYNVVERHLGEGVEPGKGRGPHGLRHACARHLVEAGRSFKEVGDHLGHRNADSTRIYAKVDLTSLRLVAFDDLGGLT